MFADLLNGFSTALAPTYLLMCVAGVLLGQIVGALPGIGPSSAIALLLPLTYGSDPVGALILFAGLYCGTQYGGTLTSVLVNVPGEASSVMTALDGHQMALQGRAGSALGIAALGSFIAGTLSTAGLMLLAPPLAKMALAFGPPEYFALVILGLTSLAAVNDSVAKGLAMAAAGLLLATIGIDQQSGVPRFTFGQLWLLDGVEFTIIAIAMFGVGEVLASCANSADAKVIEVKSVFPTRADWQASRMPILRGTAIGFIVGVLPAAGATIASFISYIVEKKLARDPSRFGKGAIEGVAGPEAANNAAVSGNLVPMFALGVPGSGTTAIMLGALIMFGLRPGPQLFTQNATLVWGTIASLYIANVLLLVLNMPLAGLFAKLLRVSYQWLYAPILALCVLGAFANKNNLQDCWLLVLFGAAGWMFKRYRWPLAPLVLGLVLGPILENSLRQSLALSHGGLAIFVLRPISLGLLVVAALTCFGPALYRMGRRLLGRPATAAPLPEAADTTAR